MTLKFRDRQFPARGCTTGIEVVNRSHESYIVAEASAFAQSFMSGEILQLKSPPRRPSDHLQVAGDVATARDRPNMERAFILRDGAKGRISSMLRARGVSASRKRLVRREDLGLRNDTVSRFSCW